MSGNVSVEDLKGSTSGKPFNALMFFVWSFLYGLVTLCVIILLGLIFDLFPKNSFTQTGFLVIFLGVVLTNFVFVAWIPYFRGYWECESENRLLGRKFGTDLEKQTYENRIKAASTGDWGSMHSAAV